MLSITWLITLLITIVHVCFLSAILWLTLNRQKYLACLLITIAQSNFQQFFVTLFGGGKSKILSLVFTGLSPSPSTNKYWFYQMKRIKNYLFSIFFFLFFLISTFYHKNMLVYHPGHPRRDTIWFNTGVLSPWTLAGQSKPGSWSCLWLSDIRDTFTPTLDQSIVQSSKTDLCSIIGHSFLLKFHVSIYFTTQQLLKKKSKDKMGKNENMLNTNCDQMQNSGFHVTITCDVTIFALNFCFHLNISFTELFLFFDENLSSIA